MIWRIKSFFSRIRSRIFNVFSGRSSLYRVENLRKGATSTLRKEKENPSMSVDKGIRKYEKRQMAARGERQYNFFNLKNIIILIILFFTFVYIHMAGYSVTSLYIAIFIFIALTLYLLIVERFKERVEVHDEIKEIKRLYSYEKVNLLGLKQSFLNIRNKDFYYAIGDGNYSFEKVTDVNMILKTFEVVFVFFDEYNW